MAMRVLAILLTMIAVCCVDAVRSAATAPPGSAVPGTWATAPPMLDGRAAHAVVVADGAVYALAGTGGDGHPVLQ